MGKKDKAKKGKGAEKTAAKTMKKQQNKFKKELSAKGEVSGESPGLSGVVRRLHQFFSYSTGRPGEGHQRT